MRSGGLFAGYGGLEMAIAEVFGAEPAWFSEIEPGPSKILAHHWPTVPNHGDITKIDWDQVEPVDILAGGYPCQPFSQAGQRQGTDDARHLWPYVADGIGRLRPEFCVFENVRGHLTLGFDEVLRDLQLLNYDTQWVLLRAADVGAPHGRARIFILGRNRGRRLLSGSDRRGGVHRDSGSGGLIPGAPEGGDDRQGLACSSAVAHSVRRQDHSRSTADRKLESQFRLAAHGDCGIQGDRGIAASLPGEVGSGCDRTAIPADGGCLSSPAERPGDLDRRDAPARIPVRGPDSRSEPTRSGPGAATPTICSAARGLQVGDLVGPGRGLVWASGVLWSLPECRTDGGGEDLRATGLGGSYGVLLATDTANLGHERGRQSWDRGAGSQDRGGLTADSDRDALREQPVAASVVGSDPAAAADSAFERRRTARRYDGVRPAGLVTGDIDWGQYAPAIHRWERILGRVAPAPTELGAKGGQRLAPRFVEWMQGLPAGHVTAVPGVNRNAQLKALGNGVVPQQASAALRHMYAALPLREAV